MTLQNINTLTTVSRVTGINTFTNLGFSNRQIMAVTGHKSKSSLLVYQKVSKDEKLRMGMSLGHAMLNVPQPKPIAPVQLKAIEPAPSTSSKPETTATSVPTIMPKQADHQMIVAIPDGNQEIQSSPKTPTLEISASDIVEILEQCESGTVK